MTEKIDLTDELLDENGTPLEMCGNDDCEHNYDGFCCKEKWDECPEEEGE